MDAGGVFNPQAWKELYSCKVVPSYKMIYQATELYTYFRTKTKHLTSWFQSTSVTNSGAPPCGKVGEITNWFINPINYSTSIINHIISYWSLQST